MSTGTKIINYIVIALLAFAVGFYMGGCDKKEGGEGKTEKSAAKSKKADEKKPLKPAKTDEDRFKVPYKGANKIYDGPDNALVTIVEFSEFQCPFCKRVTDTLDKIKETWPNEVAIYFRHNPLPFHKDAFGASEAALAAAEQGKFKEMYKKLWENNRNLKRADLEKYAEELGLDMAKFKEALDTNKFKKDIKKDQALARQFAARGTPHFFINGIRVKGAQPFEKFKTIIEQELAHAKQFKGADNIYAKVTANAKSKAETKKKEPPKRKEDTNIYKVSTGDKKLTPMKGKEDALITIVEFSEYQCPFCKRVEPTIDQLMEDYEGKIRVFFRHNPLPFHKNAMPAAKAAIAAHLQGKFWEFHKKAFANQRNLTEENFLKWAKELGLNVEKFKKDMDSKAVEGQIKTDQAEARKFGSRGTPGFFINGRKLSGAQPIGNFKKLIDELLPIAEKNGKKGDALYAALTAKGLDKAEPRKPRKPKEDPNKVYDVSAGDSFFKGPKDAPVEILEFSEFQCPFCKRVNPTIDKIMKEFEGKVKVVFKHNPLPFHKDAPLASQAALAAGEQGKFWEMHDKLFENNRQLKRADLERYAKEIGLDVERFKKALDSGAYKSMIEADQKMAKKVGARGTPTFFINGKKLVGAQPYEAFKARIEEELKAKK